MATLEERVQALEQQVELHTVAIGGLASKTMLESISEKNDKIFKALADHDSFTNRQLAELRVKVEDELDGKIVGMQTEMRQRFTRLEEKQVELDGKIVGVQTEMRQRFAQVDQRFDLIDQHLAQVDQRFDLIDQHLAQVDQRFDLIDRVLAQILARLPESPHS